MIPEDFEDWPWGEPAGRDLEVAEPAPGKWERIVGCLNVWQDIDELKRTFETWYPYVDHVVAVDGPYITKHVPVTSNDGTIEFLKQFENVQVITVSEPWPDQCTKRTHYFDLCGPGDLCWIVDADEFVYNGQAIRETPDLDVGWIRCRSYIYHRVQQQPRVFQWVPGIRYDNRHHWIYNSTTSKQITSHQRGGEGVVHRLLPIAFDNSRGAKRTRERQGFDGMIKAGQAKLESEKSRLQITGYEPLRIFQTGPFDPIAMGRLHTAINTTTPHESTMATFDHRPFGQPLQYSFEKHGRILMDIGATCDILHNHVSYVGAHKFNAWSGRKPLVMHHHGTNYRRFPEEANRLDADRACLRLISNLELAQYGENLQFLPNALPVKLYSLMGRPEWKKDGPFRIAHSPSKPKIKGTEVFMRVCEELESLKVEPVLIVGKPLIESLRIKATCHAVFDSFWLGLQQAGCEGAAMGLPVLAGDQDCRKGYLDLLGEVPYTFAEETTLKDQIVRLATDWAFYVEQARRVHEYVLKWHDGANVAALYLELLDEALHWREQLAIGAKPRLLWPY